MKTRNKLVAALISTLMLGACASVPPSPELSRLDSELMRLRGDDRVAVHGDAELSVAERAINELHDNGRRLSEDEFDHRVYRADRLLKIAEAEALARFAEERADHFTRERAQLAAQLREQELAKAQQALSSAQIEAERQRQQATRYRDDAMSARNEAELARLQAEAAQQEAAQLQAELASLQAKETERGMLLTLGDVLFEVDRAELKPGATLKLDELAAVLKRNESAEVDIEGHTDSTGTRAYNLELSQRRAEAVRDYLISRGVPAERVSARGLGPDYPVASNTDQAGRTQNRRVDIVIQSDQGWSEDTALSANDDRKRRRAGD